MSMGKCPVCGNLVFTNDSHIKSDEFEALADIRRWACETLDASDAGRLCGMLSDVSRHANGLKAENEKLKELIADVHGELYADKTGIFHRLILEGMEYDMRELGIEVNDE